MTASPYSNEPWLSRAAAHRAQPGNDMCVICGRRSQLHVHHRLYRTDVYPYPRCVGRSEQPGDLVTLCWLHHQQLHDWFDACRLTREDLADLPREAAEVVRDLQGAAPAGAVLAEFTDWYIARAIFVRLDELGWFDAIESSELREWTLADSASRPKEFLRILNAELERRREADSG
jgi:hypothetical protein